MSDYLTSLYTPTMRGYLYFIVIIVIGELVFHALFALVVTVFGLAYSGVKAREVFKGVLERLMLSIGLAHGIPTVVIVFGALKVATKLSLTSADTKPEHVASHNDYFIIGNVLSILFGIIYALIAVHWGFVTIGFTSQGR